jgi:hypothetical protein
MKTVINIGGETPSGFRLSEVVDKLPMLRVWVPGRSAVGRVTDFGTVFVGGTGHLSPGDIEFMSGEGPLFEVPRRWRWPQLLRALGAFPSATQAAKNGWDLDFGPGVTTATVRVRKIRGEIMVVNL